MTDLPDRTLHADDPRLSPMGETRRRAMLGELLSDMRAVHRRRRLRRRSMIAIAPLIAMGVSVAWWWPRPMPRDRANLELAAPHVVIATRPHAPAVNIKVMSDQDLLDELAALNRPAGLVRSGSKVWLTQPVTDDATRERGTS